MIRKLLIVFICLFSVAAAQAQTYLYFDNIAPTEISNGAYWDRIQKLDAFNTKFKKVPFSDATFGQYAKPDLVVIALFTAPLSAKPNGSSKTIIQKVQEWIALGVDVLIFGNAVIQGTGDPLVADLLFDKLQMAPIGVRMVNYEPFLMQGSKGDPVGNGVRHYMNATWTWIGISGEPLVRTDGVQIFRVKDSTKAFPTEHFWAAGSKSMNYSDTDYGKAFFSDSLLGIRTQIGDSKIALWTAGLELAAGTSGRESTLNYALHWLVYAANVNAPVLSVLDPKVNWGVLDQGDTVIKSASIQNSGKEDLIINKLEWALNTQNSFKLVGGHQTPITIKSGQVHNIDIEFTPPGTENYTGWLTVRSNDPETPEFDIVLNGSGGLTTGPILSSDKPGHMLDFGEVQIGRYKIIDFNVKNIGDEMVTIQRVDTSQILKDDIFTLIQGSSYPYELQPGVARPMKMRFEPDSNKVYTGSMIIMSNASNGQFEIFMIGKGVPKPSGAVIATDVPQNTLNFGSVMRNKTKTLDVNIRNTGTETMLISKIDTSSFAMDGVFNVIQGGASPVEIAAKEMKNVVVNFTPKDSNKVYNAYIRIFSNANVPEFNINLTGTGAGGTSVGEEYNSYMSIAVTPNPASDNAMAIFMNNTEKQLKTAIKIIDMAGAATTLFEGFTDPGMNLLNLNLTSYPAGAYMLVAETEEGAVRFKINKN